MSPNRDKKRGSRSSIWLPITSAVLGAIVALVGSYLAFLPAHEDVMRSYLHGLKGGYKEQFHAIRVIAEVHGIDAAIEIERRFRSGATIRALEEIKQSSEKKKVHSRIDESLEPIKRVLVLDSVVEGNIYDPLTSALGETNVEDIVEEIKMLPIRIIGRRVEGSWSDKDEDAIVELKPDLIVMHLGSFERVKQQSDDKAVARFIIKISKRLDNTRFVVYSRQGIDPLKKMKEKAEVEASRNNIDMTDRIALLPILLPQLFSARENSSRIKKAVLRTLDLGKLYERTWDEGVEEQNNSCFLLVSCFF